jgi:hypothetical protein
MEIEKIKDNKKQKIFNFFNNSATKEIFRRFGPICKNDWSLYKTIFFNNLRKEKT